MRLGILSVRGCIKRADIADSPFGRTPNALVLNNVSGQDCTRIEAVRNMCQLEHARVLKAFQMLAEHSSVLAAGDLGDDTVLNGQADGRVRNATKRRRHRTVKHNLALNRAKARYDIDLTGQHVDPRLGGVAAIASGIMLGFDLERYVTACRCGDAHVLCILGTLGHSQHEVAQLCGLNLSDRTDHQCLIKIYQAHIAQLLVLCLSALERCRIQQPLVIELDPHVGVQQHTAECVECQIRIGRLAHAARSRHLYLERMRTNRMGTLIYCLHDSCIRVVVGCDDHGLTGLNGKNLADQLVRSIL